MTGNCVRRAQSNSARDAHTEYTPVAGTDSNVGIYLRAYAYYAANAGKTWTRTEPPSSAQWLRRRLPPRRHPGSRGAEAMSAPGGCVGGNPTAALLRCTLRLTL